MDATRLQARLFDFAIAELVRRHRESFAPPWSVESWAKLMIWLALNCGCSGDGAGLEAFAAALGPGLSGRLRRVFFERELEDLNLRLLADPAEPRVLVLPTGGGGLLAEGERIATALARVDLAGRVVAAEQWERREALLAIPWIQP